MITTEEAERIDGEFEEAFAIETVSTRQATNKMYEAWQDLYSIMEGKIIIRINWGAISWIGSLETGQMTLQWRSIMRWTIRNGQIFL